MGMTRGIELLDQVQVSSFTLHTVQHTARIGPESTRRAAQTVT